MPTGSPVDGFTLTYDRHGSPAPGRPTVVLLHGWPGDRTDMGAVAERLAGDHDVVVPDLRGFGESDKHHLDPAEFYGPAGQARSVAGLVEELGIAEIVVGGYDVGSRVGQQLAKNRPDLLRALVVTPPAPGVGQRILGEAPFAEFWYQSFHQLDLAERLVDGKPEAARDYVGHFWSHWSGPAFTPDDSRLDHMASVYGPAGAFVASIGWYRAGGGVVARSLAETVPDPADRITVPTTFVWPEHDPLFPRAWSDRLDEFFADVSVVPADGVGHFVPVEDPDTFAGAVRAATGVEALR
ncbi:alpha/beta fold hydrolase [Pseudonocardia endophytica]|uniref:Pimeloyl-ACP methyl ester carboxylesterase n=1 Tax=Pseudonocardia endophytica TaxID=401976 RepID=A0A4R1HRZ3_PSEEN|nr:alpha/beta hydrolase [Pseudonocardia endophytica]TCK22589.1 pimeloyl-ACP methyl ester carboxylesterase [Pseudonocardia endophytica]